MSIATGQPLWFFANLARVLVTPEESEGALGIVESTGAHGEMPPLHIHHEETRPSSSSTASSPSSRRARA